MHSSNNIYTLIPDIYELIKRKDGWFHDNLSEVLSKDIARRLQVQLGEARSVPRLRLSQLGPRCPCALWHSIHSPDEGEPLPPWAEIKYSYGHIIEALALCLARAAGHEVTGEQDELSVDGIIGHRDAVVDGNIVDVKSCSSIAFKKFADGSIKDNDTFGYLDQLDAYVVGSLLDPLVHNKRSAFILAIDKTLGHMVLYEHEIREDSVRLRIEQCRSTISLPRPPGCTCRSIPDGKSGNLRLDTRASYSAQKYLCNPMLRTFLYSDGPRYLTHVARKPDVTEVDRHGKIIYT